MIHVMSFCLFDVTDTDLIRGHTGLRSEVQSDSERSALDPYT